MSEGLQQAPVLGEDGLVQREPAPPTITSLLEDYARRPPPKASSLGLFMDDRQMRDAGVHPEQLDTERGYSVIDATGAGDPKADPAGGYAKVARVTRGAVTGAHAAAAWLARAGGAAASDPMVKGVKTLGAAYSLPLNVVEGLARGATDRRNGASWGNAIVGNGFRTGVVVAAGGIPILGPWAANKYLPDGAVMGERLNADYSDPEKLKAVLLAGS